MRKGTRKTAPFDYYWGVARRRLPQVLLVSFAAALAAFVLVRQTGPTHQIHFSYLVSMSEREAPQEFRFDGFYALSATDLFAATLASLLQTPEVIVAEYQEAGLPLDSRDPRQLTKRVRAEKTAPQLVEVTVRHESKEMAERLTAGLMLVTERNVAAYHDQGVPAVTFAVVATEPWAGMTELSGPVIVAATFVFVFFIAMNGLLLLASVKKMG